MQVQSSTRRGPKPIPPDESFWPKVDKSGDCWIWQGAPNGSGYGTFRKIGAHRWAYENLRGPIPQGLHIDHLCRNRLCVNPNHMDLVTQAENLYRSPLTIATINGTKTHCKYGHPFDAANTGLSRYGRYCKECDKQHKRLIRATS